MDNIKELNKLIENSRILANIKEEDIEWVPKEGDIIVFKNKPFPGFDKITVLTKVDIETELNYLKGTRRFWKKRNEGGTSTFFTKS